MGLIKEDAAALLSSVKADISQKKKLRGDWDYGDMSAKYGMDIRSMRLKELNNEIAELTELKQRLEK